MVVPGLVQALCCKAFALELLSRPGDASAAMESAVKVDSAKVVLLPCSGALCTADDAQPSMANAIVANAQDALIHLRQMSKSDMQQWRPGCQPLQACLQHDRVITDPVLIAIIEICPEVVKRLLECGRDVNVTSRGNGEYMLAAAEIDLRRRNVGGEVQ